MIVSYAAAASAAVKVDSVEPMGLFRAYALHDEDGVYTAISHHLSDIGGSIMCSCPCPAGRPCPHVQAVVIRDMEDRAREATHALIRDSEREYEAARQEAQ